MQEKRIELFLEIVRSPSLPVSPGQLVAAFELIMERRKRSTWPSDIRRQASLVAPVICSSPSERQEYELRLEEWLAEVPVPPPSPLPPSPAKAKSRKPALLFGAIAAMTALAVVMIMWRNSAPERVPIKPELTSGILSGRVVGSNRFPLSKAQIRFKGRVLETASDGGFSIRYTARDIPFDVLISSGTFSTRLIRVDTMTEASIEIVLGSREASVQIPELRTVNEFVRSQLSEWIVQYGVWIFLISFCVPFAIVPLSLVLADRRMVFRKWSTSFEPRLRTFGQTRRQYHLFRRGRLQSIAASLLKMQDRRSGPHDLDIRRSVDQSIWSGGLFTPAYMARQARAEYLCLIQRVTPGDHYSRLHDVLLDDLAAIGVHIDRYYYASDPRVCVSHDTNMARRRRSLHELTSIYPTHRVCVFGQMSGFINSTSTWLSPAGEALQNWPSSAIFDDAIFSRSTEECDLLSAGGIELRPDSSESLESYALQDDTSSAFEERPFPLLLRELPEYWLKRDGPDRALIDRLNTQLRIFLDEEAYLALRACAVYPAVFWELTIHMVQQMSQRMDPEIVMGRLARLPWFRFSSMPDWLRRRLLIDLDDESRQRINRALESFLEEMAKQRDQLGPLIIAEKRAIARESDQSSAVQDFVFATFILGLPLDRLSVRVPSHLRLLLGKRDRLESDWGLTGWISLMYASVSSLMALLFIVIVGGLGYVEQRRQSTEVTTKLAQEQYIPPADPRLSVLIDVAGAQVGQRVSGILVDRVISIASGLLGNHETPVEASVEDGTGRFRRINLPFPFNHVGVSSGAMSQAIRPGMITFGTNGIVETVNNSTGTATLIYAPVQDSVVERLRVPLGRLADLWDPVTGRYLTSTEDKPVLFDVSGAWTSGGAREVVHWSLTQSSNVVTSEGADGLGRGYFIGPFQFLMQWKTKTSKAAINGNIIEWDDGFYWVRSRTSLVGDQNPNVTGKWSPGNDRKMVHWTLEQDNQGLITSDGDSGYAEGYYTGRGVFVMLWKGVKPLSATVRGNTLYWDNGTYWVRQQTSVANKSRNAE
jgi:hypothetical protein